MQLRACIRDRQQNISVHPSVRPSVRPSFRPSVRSSVHSLQEQMVQCAYCSRGRLGEGARTQADVGHLHAAVSSQPVVLHRGTVRTLLPLRHRSEDLVTFKEKGLQKAPNGPEYIQLQTCPKETSLCCLQVSIA